MRNYVTIKLQHKMAAFDWAKTHCPNFITADHHMVNYESYDTFRFDFFFDDSDAGQKEMVLFALRWL